MDRWEIATLNQDKQLINYYTSEVLPDIIIPEESEHSESDVYSDEGSVICSDDYDSKCSTDEELDKEELEELIKFPVKTEEIEEVPVETETIINQD